MSKIVVKHECTSCSGTGLYCGFAEPKGTAVVCMRCDGKGWQKTTFNEFTGRNLRKGIHKVSLSSGSLLVTGIGATGQSMTYEEFQKKFPVGE